MIPFSPPRIDQRTIDEVVDALNSGWITTGPKTKLLENKLTEFCSSKSTICVSSATAGLELILKWFGVGEGDEVIVPAYTYCATANVVLHCGARPVLVDINKDDFNISVREVRKAITSETKVILPVDIGGMPCDYSSLREIVNDPEIISKFRPINENQKMLGRILILSDAAHSLGAFYNGTPVGSVSDITVFSFHAVKNLTTAEGGAIAFNLPKPFDNKELYKYFNVLCLHGQSKDALAKTKKGAWKYDVLLPGYKANMTDVLAAIGLVEIDRYKEENMVKRKMIFDLYSQAFSKYEWAELPPYSTENRTSSFHLFILRIKQIAESQRDEIIQRIFDGGVSVNVHFQPLPMFTYYKSIGYKMSDYPVAYDNYARAISLPVYYDLTIDQVDKVIDTVSQAVNSMQ